MSEKLLSIKDVAKLMNMSLSTVRNYVNGFREPQLPTAKKVVVDARRIEVRISQADFETWKAAYEQKKPFGAKLHKKRQA